MSVGLTLFLYADTEDIVALLRRQTIKLILLDVAIIILGSYLAVFLLVTSRCPRRQYWSSYGLQVADSFREAKQGISPASFISIPIAIKHYKNAGSRLRPGQSPIRCRLAYLRAPFCGGSWLGITPDQCVSWPGEICLTPRQ